MFPILALGGAALGGYSVMKLCVTAVFGSKVLSTTKDLALAKARESVDVNPEFERKLYEYLREASKETVPEGVDKALKMGIADIREVELPLGMLPPKYAHLAGFWYVTHRDAFVLQYFLLHVQAGDAHENKELEAVVRTIQSISTQRHDSPVHRQALGWRH